MRGRISAQVLQLISGVAKVRVCAAENHAFRQWALRFSEQRRISFKIGTVQNVVKVVGAAFPVVSSLAIFYTLYYMKAKAGAAGSPDAVSISTGSFIAFNAAYGVVHHRVADPVRRSASTSCASSPSSSA